MLSRSWPCKTFSWPCKTYSIFLLFSFFLKISASATMSIPPELVFAIDFEVSTHFVQKECYFRMLYISNCCQTIYVEVWLALYLYFFFFFVFLFLLEKKNVIFDVWVQKDETVKYSSWDNMMLLLNGTIEGVFGLNGPTHCIMGPTDIN